MKHSEKKNQSQPHPYLLRVHKTFEIFLIPDKIIEETNTIFYIQRPYKTMK